MAQVTLKGNPIQTRGNLPDVGENAPTFSLTNSDLAEVSLDDFKGKKVIINIFPSIDTPVCAISTKKFNEEAGQKEGVAVLCVSKDLPFAHKRFCAAEGVENVTALSELRDTKFGEDYGIQMVDGPLANLFARAIVVVDENGKVAHRELVPEIANEPDYAAALEAVS